jgi:ankyrin repeat protein
MGKTGCDFISFGYLRVPTPTFGLLRCVQARADPDMGRSFDGFTPLSLAVAAGSRSRDSVLSAAAVALATALLDASATPDLILADGRSPLVLAAKATTEGTAALLVQALVQAGALPDRRDPTDGHTALNGAAARGDLAVCRILLDAHATTDWVTREVVTTRGRHGEQREAVTAVPALVRAAAGGHLAVVTELLARGAAPNLPRTPDGATALFVAAFQGHDSVVAVLLSNGADPNLARSDYAGGPLHNPAAAGHLGTMQMLLTAKADPNAVTADRGATPLLLAATAGRPAAVALLLRGGADPDQSTTDREGSYPLVGAASRGHLEVVNALLACKADPDVARHRDGATALLLAVERGHRAVVAALLPFADPNKARLDGATPLSVAVHSKAAEVVRELTAAGASLKQERLGGQHSSGEGGGCVGAVAAFPSASPPNAPLLSASLEVETATTLLLAAAMGGDADTVLALLAVPGVDADGAAINDGLTALLVASMQGNVELAKLLLLAGVDPNLATTDVGATPLFFAAQQGYLEVAELLVASGATAGNALTSNGATELWAGCWQGHVGVVRFLLALPTTIRASVTQRRTDPRTGGAGIEGTSPLEVAERCGHSECAAAVRAALA